MLIDSHVHLVDDGWVHDSFLVGNADAVGPWRLHFGSDGPYLNVLFPLADWVRAVRDPDLSGCPGVSFTREELDMSWGGPSPAWPGCPKRPRRPRGGRGRCPGGRDR